MKYNRFVYAVVLGLIVLCMASATVYAQQLPNLTNQNPSVRFPLTGIVWATNAGEASVCLWADDKLGALSLAVDDNSYGNVAWWTNAAAQHGFKVTWFIITDRICKGTNPGADGTWAQWNQVQALGHDVQSHTAWHLHPELPEWTNIDDEYRIAQEQIETNMPGHKCDFLAFPGGANIALNNRTNAAKYYAAGRGGAGLISTANKIDYFAVNTMSGYNTNPTNDPTKRFNNLNSLVDGLDWNYYRGWAVCLSHYISDYNSMSGLLNFIDANQTNLWIGLFGDVAKYGQERDTAMLTTNENSSSRLAYSLSDRMMDGRFNYPLTLKVRLPAAWFDAQANQNGTAIETRVVENNGARYALVKAVPDRGEIVLLPAGAVTGFSAFPASGWAPLPVSFSDTSTGAITNRFWDFGDGTTLNTTAVSVSHTYTSAGNKTVQLIASGPDGVSTNTQAGCVQVTTAVAPSAGFTLSPASGTVPLTVSFTDTSVGDITNRFWNFGDGVTTNTTATSIAHTYTSVGTNTVQLTVSGPAGMNTRTQVDVIRVSPVPPAEVYTLLGNTNDRNVFEYPLSSPASNVWKVGTRRVGDTSGTPGNRSTLVIPFLLPVVAQTNFTSVTLSMVKTAKASWSPDANGVYIEILGGRVSSSPVTTDADIIPPTVLLAHAELISSNATLGAVNYTLPASFFKAIYTNDPSAAGKYVFITLRPNLIDPNSANSYINYASVGDSTPSNRPVISITAVAGQPVGDSDSDGIPDSWEVQYFGGSTNANPSALAANGVNTIYETYIAGLNPTNPASVLLISDFQPLASQSVLQWQSASGRVYSVYWTTNLLNGFQPLETNILWPQNSWTDLVHGAQNENFYRIKVQLGQ